MSFFRKIKTSSHINGLFGKKAIDLAGHDAHRRHLVIYHIDPETEGTFNLTVQNEDLGELVLERVCAHYNLNEYREYFGLKYTLVDEHGDHEIFWLDPTKLVGKQLKNTNNVLTFRVKHFPAKPDRIESEYVRYLVFLQLRNYLLRGDLHLPLTEEVRLASYAVQAALGDYEPAIHEGNYLSSLKFLSQKSLKAEQLIMESHKQLQGKTPGEMELEFLEKASQFDTYGAEMIRVRNSKDVLINFGVSHNGIITYLYENSFAATLSSRIEIHPWTQIGKISYEGKLIKITVMKPDDKNSEIFKKNAMVFKCNSSRVCKHLWKFILDQRSFFNFERGTDVPKVKSSSGIFSRKSKFRFTGRCEHEVITAQPNDLANNTSFGTTKTSGGGALSDSSMETTRASSNHKYATLPLTTTATLSIDEDGQNHVQLRNGDGGGGGGHVFRRRTFIHTSTLKSLHKATKDASLNASNLLNSTARSSQELDTSHGDDHSTASTSKLPLNSTIDNSILFDIESKELSKGRPPSSTVDMHRTLENSADHNNNSLLADSFKTPPHANGTLQSKLLNEAANETPAGTVFVADFRPDELPPSRTLTLRRQSASQLSRLKAVYLGTIDYVQSKQADKFVFFTFLFIIVAFILIWFVNKQCLAFGWSDTSRVCQVTNQLSNALSFGKHRAASRWPTSSSLAVSGGRVLDPLFAWFFSFYH